jgi:hypothetical protein
VNAYATFVLRIKFFQSLNMDWNAVRRLADAVDSKIQALGISADQELSTPVLREARNAITELRNVGTAEQYMYWKMEVGFALPEEYVRKWFESLREAAVWLIQYEYEQGLY